MPVPMTMERKQAAYTNLRLAAFAICRIRGTPSRGRSTKGQQYSHIYFTRLHHMRNLLHALVPSWKPQVPVTTVLGLEEGKDCIIVGTLYKHMKLKPSILDEYSKERSAIPLVKPHNFMHPDDHLILEDESGRVTLAGAIAPAEYVTGVVLALRGKETSAGNFLVEDVLEAGLPHQTSLSAADEDKYVVFVSGLSVGSATFNPLQFQFLIDHITGHLGDENEQSIASKIARVVVAGNSVHISPRFLNGQMVASKDQSRIAEPIKELDIMLTQLVASLPVDIMPGCHDPANFSLPQQTIDDLYKYSDAKDRLEFMERTLRWRHLAPTAPNSLGCYPYTDKDPFLIDSCPHVYFVGNQDKYETRLFEGPEKQKVRLICIPRFSDSGVAVMLNLRNLECSTLSFSTSFDA
ncbi:hypothetical protein PR202_gb18450 [Eleusine coracana subsp. coracana]|uniref:DNA polymerase delta small subunit n=1 Tax=Eleusine coracana subsp. coracana TaxID=191504 RepID=A0AAV5F389_ELECO|nr:hypothetical protein PR202_gb18450 [Eleusine coracana subsp. coracana]